MMVPRKALEDELKQQEKELTDDINNLNKKVCSSRHLGDAAITVCNSRNILRSSSQMHNLSCEI
jgi:hypothetical protein